MLCLAVFTALLTVAVAPKLPGETPVPWDTLPWHHTKLDSAAVRQREKERVDSVEFPTTSHNAAVKAFNDQPDQPQKYTRINTMEERYVPLCKAYFVRVNGKQWDTCSCAFIKPKLVVLAAHCFTTYGADANKDMSVFVVQQFATEITSIESFEKKFAGSRNFAEEWWYSASYSRPPGVKPSQYAGNGYDLAFIRTEKASINNAYYKLIKPEGKFGDKPYDLKLKGIQALGYPSDFGNSHAAVAFEGKLVSYATETPADMLCITGKDTTDKPKQWDMGKGGSGGPWILTDAALKTEPLKQFKDDLKMAMFGIYGYGPINEQTMPIAWRTGCGVHVTDAVLKVAEKIDAFKSPVLAATKVGDKMKTAGGDEVTKVDAQTETVLFKL